MRSFIVLLFALLGMALCVPSSDLVAEEWENYKLKYNKAYENDVEEKSRMEIFMENRNMIAKHNAEYEMGLVSYQMELNNFSDWFPHELEPMMNCFDYRQAKLYREKNADKVSTFLMPAHVTLPDQVDWRAKGAVTPVKNQGNCGSCYAFSTTGALEGAHFQNTSKLVSLSEQQLVDCSSKYGNNGCDGGTMDRDFTYIKENGGIASESSYPYKAVEDTCHYNPSDKAATVESYVDIKTGDEEALKAAVATIGPVSVAIDVKPSFTHPKPGVYYEPECDPVHLVHAVLVVGYGTEGGNDYWLVKNSWGTSWGDKGYIKMARNRGNNCGIATFASYPVV